MPLTKLGDYLLELLEDQNLSMREGSIKAGLDPTTISQILRRGKTSTPRPDTLRAIADGLGGDFNKMMVLAGHIPKPPESDDIAELRYIADQLIERWLRIKDRDEEALRRLTSLVLTQAEAFEAAVNAATRNMEEEAQQEEPESTGGD